MGGVSPQYSPKNKRDLTLLKKCVDMLFNKVLSFYRNGGN